MLWNDYDMSNVRIMQVEMDDNLNLFCNENVIFDIGFVPAGDAIWLGLSLGEVIPNAMIIFDTPYNINCSYVMFCSGEDGSLLFDPLAMG